MPLWALALLHSWRAVGETRRVYWYVLAVTLGLLLLTTYFGLILVVLLILFLVLSERRGARSLGSIDFLDRRHHRRADDLPASDLDRPGERQRHFENSSACGIRNPSTRTCSPGCA